MTPLCELAFKYGTDKCPQIKHSYTPYYYELFNKNRKSIKKVMELGVARGASLRMWRDFFPNAQVYGVDIRPDRMFSEDRITTIVANEKHGGEWDRVLTQTGADIDIFIDDGLHDKISQMNVCRYLMPRFQQHITYIIEDVTRPDDMVRNLENIFVCWRPKLYFAGNTWTGELIQVKHKI